MGAGHRCAIRGTFRVERAYRLIRLEFFVVIDIQSHVETNQGLSKQSKASTAMEISGSQVPRSTTRRMFLAYLPSFAGISIMVCHGGCVRDPRSDRAGDQRQFKVVATTGMIGDMLREICGESVEIVQLIQAGVDPHDSRRYCCDRSIRRGIS